LVVPPYIVEFRENADSRALTDPLSTIVASAKHHGVIIPPFLTSYYSQSQGGQPLTGPMGTVTSVQRHALIVPPFLVNYYTHDTNPSVLEAMPTQTTQTKFGVAVPTDKLSVEDCGFRMIQSHEIGSAMAFPGDYTVLGTERERVKQYGNAVTPPVMAELIERCVKTLCV